ncbi:MAG: hypothetical protein R3Y60_04015 [bacterium]
MSKVKQRTKQNIKEALTLLLSEENNINNVSVKQLADKVGINRSTFYLHYHDITEVADEISNEIMDDIFKGYEVINTIEDIYSLLNYSIEYIELNNHNLLAYIYLDDIELVILKFKNKAFDIISSSKLLTKYNSNDFNFYLKFYLDGLLQSIISSIKTNDFTIVKNNAVILFNKLFT